MNIYEDIFFWWKRLHAVHTMIIAGNEYKIHAYMRSSGRKTSESTNIFMFLIIEIIKSIKIKTDTFLSRPPPTKKSNLFRAAGLFVNV